MSERRKQADSRERLLESAIALISERGYSATSVDAICRRAGTVKTALYWHFESKEGLLAAVVERVAESWIEEIRKTAYLEGDPYERLERVLDGLQEILEERPHLLRLLMAVQLERSDVSPRTRAALKTVIERAEQALVEGIEDAMGTPLRDLDLIAHSVVSLLEGALLRRLVDPEISLDRLFKELRRVIVLSIGHRLSDDERARWAARAPRSPKSE